MKREVGLVEKWRSFRASLIAMEGQLALIIANV
jgi:hypothetical protein